MPPAARPLSDRFWPKVKKTDTCWLWTASIRRDGYGQIRGEDGRNLSAHRVAYASVIGPVPIGLELDHLCRVRRCVNPAHLEPVTHRENDIRGTGAAAVNAAKTACHRGHPLVDDNLYVRPNGWRTCRSCQRASELQRKDGASFLL